MPYVGHNVYGARSTDYSATGGRVIPRKLTDCWCEPCWWTQFAPEVKPDHRGRMDWGGAHGDLGFYWWPARMAGAVKCCQCELNYNDPAIGVTVENEHRAAMQARYADPARFDAVGNPLRIGDVVTIGWRDSNRPKETGHVRNLASRVTIDTATHHGLVADYRDVLAVGRA